MSVKSIQAAAMVVFCFAGFALGEEPSNWLNWRGPQGNGSSQDDDWLAIVR